MTAQIVHQNMVELKQLSDRKDSAQTVMGKKWLAVSFSRRMRFI